MRFPTQCNSNMPRPGDRGRRRRMTGVCNGTEYHHRPGFRRPPKLGQITSGIPYCASGLRGVSPHQALFTHHLLEKSDSDWGICEVNLMPGNDARLIANLKAQNLLYTVAERGAESTELKIIGSMKEALHPEFDGHAGILAAMARPKPPSSP